MYVDTSCSDAPAASSAPVALQRAEGRARIVFASRDGATRLERLYQEGAAKMRLPRVFDGTPQAVIINTAGGLTGGDVFFTDIEMRRGARAALTTQACERIYRSAGGDAAVSTRICLGPDARLEWLPQETILFDGGRLARTLEADLAENAELLAVESVIFGREAMGEAVETDSFHDRWRIRRGGRLLFADDLRFEGEIARLVARPAALGGNRAVATALLAAPDCERLLEPVRDAIGESGGASAWNGKLLVRIAAADGFSLRRALVSALAILMDGRPLPKVWQL